MRIPDVCPLAPGSTVWGYLRDSGGETQERSVDQQLAVLRAYCDKHQLLLERIFADAARGGDSAEDRAQLWAMLDELRARFPQIHDRRRRETAAGSMRTGVLFWSFARLGRDRIETAYLRNDLRMRGLVIASLADDILTGNDLLDPILEELLAYQNEQFLDTLSKDVRRGLHQLIAMRDNDPRFLSFNPGWPVTGRYLGIFPGRMAPRGFQFEPVTVGQRRDGRLRIVQRLVPDPEIWPRAVMAWRLRVEEQASYPRIHGATRLFNKESAYGHFFANRIYIGTLDFGESVYGTPEDPYVSPLVSPEWYEVEAERREHRRQRRLKGGAAHPGDVDGRIHSQGRLLSGLLVCARCGSRLHVGTIPAGIVRSTGKRRSAWTFYWCAGAKEHRCSAGKVAAVRLEQAILERLRTRVLSPERLRQHAARLLTDLDRRRRRLLGELEALEQALGEARRRARHLADALAARPASLTLLESLDEVETEQARLRHQLREQQAELAYWDSFEVDDDELERISARLIAALSGDDRLKARVALGAFIREIVVDPGPRLHAHIRYAVFQHTEDGHTLSVQLPPNGTAATIRRRDKNWYNRKKE